MPAPNPTRPAEDSPARRCFLDNLIALQSCPSYATHADKHDQAESLLRALDAYLDERDRTRGGPRS